MLSIRFTQKIEWWVSGETFTRLFKTALLAGRMPARLADWLDVADANGGIDLSQVAQAEADELLTALRSTAECEVHRLKHAGATTEDGSYRASLQKFLAL